MSGPEPEFLRFGGAAQERYEELRRLWTSQSPGVVGLWRMSWGQRLLRFGLLGLIEEDPTGCGWFGPSPYGADLYGPRRCVQVLLGSEDCDVRLREAYKMLLLKTIAEEPKRVVEVYVS